ncbi:MAG: acetate--CoA ligase family protein [Candidatus Aenigmarchaeota archaeon]|nr:acetate--CoA ligase family protein [Candidatus Aenigmarchaeota archaeon]
MKVLAEREAETFLKKYVSVAKSTVVKKAAGFWKPPFVLKIVSEKALHKTDIGGVVVVKRNEDAKDAYEALVAIAKKRKLAPYSIIMQEYLQGVEMIIGVKKDPAFGHAIMIGTGGTLVELIRDVSFRICPVTEKDAAQMIGELKMKKLLYGFRGSANADINALKKAIVKISQICRRHKIAEMDINPLIVGTRNAKVADARIVME